MKNIISIGVTTLLLLSLAACSSKSKNGSADPNAAVDPSISGSPMLFNAQGSDSGQINGLNSINFEYDKATLTPEIRKTLAANADWMKANSNLTVQIEGHCDDRGSSEYNISLGERRAKAVKNYLVSLGVPANKLSTISYGEEKHIQDGDNDAARSANRRANFMPLQ